MLNMIRRKKYYLILFFILICIILYGNVKAENNFAGLEKVHVNKVIDGDTVVVTGGRTVRFIGVDTPEYKSSFYAKTAAAYTKKKLLNKDIYIELDKDKYDKHGRLLAYIYLKDGEFFNASLLKKGHAMLLIISPNIKYLDLMRRMAAEARDNERGMWEDLPVLSWKNAGDYCGKLAIIRGKIVATYNSGKAVFLNFDEEYWHTFSAVIFSEDLGSFDFNPAEYYLNKKVKIIGKIKEYKGAYEIIIKLPEQINVYR